jgi:prevent-host-death family protein
LARVTAFEAKTRFGKLLERVTRGEEIVITRHDEHVAWIVPEGRANVEAVRVAAAGLRGLRLRI